MAESYGEREGTRRMTNMVLQSQENWGVIERIDRGRQIVRRKALDLRGSPVTSWLVEACLRYAGRALPMASIDSIPAIYPVVFGGSAAYLLSKSRYTEILVDSAGNQVINLAS
jgi:hypothetical protein